MTNNIQNEPRWYVRFFKAAKKLANNWMSEEKEEEFSDRMFIWDSTSGIWIDTTHHSPMNLPYEPTGVLAPPAIIEPQCADLIDFSASQEDAVIISKSRLEQEVIRSLQTADGAPQLPFSDAFDIDVLGRSHLLQEHRTPSRTQDLPNRTAPEFPMERESHGRRKAPGEMSWIEWIYLVLTV